MSGTFDSIVYSSFHFQCRYDMHYQTAVISVNAEYDLLLLSKPTLDSTLDIVRVATLYTLSSDEDEVVALFSLCSLYM